MSDVNNKAGQAGGMAGGFDDLAAFQAAVTGFSGPDAAALAGAAARNAQLTKPGGALGRLEDIAQWYCGWRGDARARITAPQVIVFAGNHGIAAQGVSAFPAEVTAQMVANFAHGGAAINQLSACFGAKLDVVALDLDRPTQDFTTGPAMDAQDLLAALNAGYLAAQAAAVAGGDLLVTGEMGIGNTTSAAAIVAALRGDTGEDWVGRGSGVDDAGVANKARVVNAGLAANSGRAPLDILGAFGGREIAAMAGAIVAARIHNIPVILDGFICCAAAAVLAAMDARALDHCIAGHVSAEQAHARLLSHLGKDPILSLGLRLGEGSGAALAIGVLQGALACHSGMATFGEAGVSGS